MPNPAVPAAQYLRMSTDDQQFSIQNQEVAIALYAVQHGFEIVQTYEDAGRSGLVANQRPGLLRLLSDIVSHRAQYKVVLVYDVSRWGRFQDVDESAHYEFLCKRAGVTIHYCAEQFENDGKISNSIMKALKRAMAGEYSRELSVKVYAGQKGVALLGFRGGGHCPYGLRRLAISKDGKRRTVLRLGEHKAVHTDRVILIPGTKKEVLCIRTIFQKTVDGSETPSQIAKYLNHRGLKNSTGGPWSYTNVYDILRNPEYAGCATWGRTTSKLHTPARNLPRSTWIVQPGAYTPIVTMETFDRVQTIIENRRTRPSKQSNRQMLDGLRSLLAERKKLNTTIIGDAPNLLRLSAYRRRFGSLINAYRRIGYKPRVEVSMAAIHAVRANSLRDSLFARIHQLFPNIEAKRLSGGRRQVLDVDGEFQVAVQLCRPICTEAHQLRWRMRGWPTECNLVTLLCLLDRTYKEIFQYYVIPAPRESIGGQKQLSPGSGWLSNARRLDNLADLYRVAKQLTVSTSEQPQPRAKTHSVMAKKRD
jgi:DNA invertase Pin-like site-specific DNA recombinase